MFTNFSHLEKAFWFYILAFGLSLTVAFFSPLLGGLTPPLVMFTPLIAVLIMFSVVTRDGYSKAGWLALGLFRPGLRSWTLAILAPFLVMLCTYNIAWGIGIGRLDPSALNQVMALNGPSNILSTLSRILLSLALSTSLALAEEVGWRGYLLPYLLPLGGTCALLLSGFLQGIWHLPIMLLSPLYHENGDRLVVAALFLLSATVGGVFFGYLRLTSASVWPAALGHGAFNMFWSTFTSITVAVASPVVLEYWAGESGVITLIEVAVVAGWLLYRLRRQSPVVRIEPALA